MNKNNTNNDIWYSNMDEDVEYGNQEIQKRINLLSEELREETTNELDRMKKHWQNARKPSFNDEQEAKTTSNNSNKEVYMIS